MARYRKVDSRIWNDAKFRRLSDSAKLVFFMLLTHPNMTALGAMRATVSGLAEELGWELKAFREAFQEVLSEGMAEHNQKACFLSLPNFLKYNPPESPNVVKAWVGAIDLLPECEQKTLVLQRSKAFAEGLSEAFRIALPEAFAKGMPYQEPEPEPEPIREKSTSQASPDPLPPVQPKRKPKSTGEVTFTAWCAQVKDRGEKLISGYAPVWTYAEKIGIQTEWVNLAWAMFKDRYSTDPAYTAKKYTDWRRHFLNAVEGNWFKLWFIKDGQFSLTTVGNQAELAMREAA